MLARFFKNKKSAPPRHLPEYGPHGGDRSHGGHPLPSHWIACPDEHAYVAAILDLDELRSGRRADVVPVLATTDECVGARATATEYAGSSSFERTRTQGIPRVLAQIVTERAPPAAGRTAVTVGFRSDPLASVALAHARLCRSDLLLLEGPRELRSAAGAARDVILVASSVLVADLGFQELTRALAGGGSTWGILCALDARELSRTVARIADHRPSASVRSRVIWCLDGDPLVTGGPNVEVLPKRAINPCNSRTVARAGFDLDVLVGHGRSYCFSAGKVCTGDPRTDHELRCSNGYRCNKLEADPELPIIRANEFDAPVLLLHTCGGGAFQPSAPVPGENVAVKLLSANALGVVATIGMNVILPTHAFLFVELVRRGFPLGEAVDVLNGCAAQRRDRVQFVLYGDPRSRLLEGRAPPPPDVHASSTGDDGLTVVLPPSDSPLQMLGVRSQDYCSNPWSWQVRAAADEWNERLQVQVVSVEGDRALWLVLWKDAQPTEPLLLHFRRRPSDEDAVFERGFATLTRWQDELRMEACDAVDGASSLEGAVFDLQGALDEARSVAGEGTRLGLPRHVPAHDLAVESARALVDAAAEDTNRRLLQRLVRRNRNTLLLEYYFAKLDMVSHVSECDADDDCPWCSDMLVTRTYVVGVLGRARRMTYECLRCEFVCDVEEGSGLVHVEGPSEIARGRAAEFSLAIRWPGRRTHVHAAANCFDRGNYNRRPEGLVGRSRDYLTLSPEIQGTVLSANETWRPSFGVEVLPDTPPNEYRVQIFFAAEGRLGLASKLVRVL